MPKFRAGQGFKDVVSGAKQNLHSNIYSAAVTKDGKADCESGQRGYPRRGHVAVSLPPHVS